MTMKKYTSVEKIKILSEDSHRKIASGLAKLSSKKIEDLEDSDKDKIIKEISDDRLDGS